MQAGGQAIVGAVTQGGGTRAKTRIDPVHWQPWPMHLSRDAVPGPAAAARAARRR